MRIEIKKISVISLLFSALPLAVYAVSFLSAVLDLANSGGAGLGAAMIGSALLRALISTFITLVFAVIGVFIYNMLSAMGIKGVRVDLDDVDDKN